MNIGSYWFSDKIVLRMYRAQEVTEAEAPDLYRMVRQLTVQAGLPMPKVYIIPDESPNTFATGRNPEHAAVAVTEGILRILTWEELAGVIGHELGHVKNRDILIQSVAATIGAAITYLGYMAMFFGGRSDEDRGGGSVIGSILLMILAPIAAMVIQMAISRSREYIAETTPARTSAAIRCGWPEPSISSVGATRPCPCTTRTRPLPTCSSSIRSRGWAECHTSFLPTLLSKNGLPVSSKWKDVPCDAEPVPSPPGKQGRGSPNCFPAWPLNRIV